MLSNRLPRISIITPSYNQGRYLEQTICSVVKQAYPNLEYIVIDGGSTDNSIEIIKKYESKIQFWSSEPDSGQAEAINKGFQLATGEIVSWINSDDYYSHGVFDKVAEAYLDCEEKDSFWLTFSIQHIHSERSRNRIIHQARINNLEQCMYKLVHVNQQGSFWSRNITQQIGLLAEQLHLGLDTEYFLRFIANGIPMLIDNDFVGATFRHHSNSKTSNYHGEIVDRSQAFLYDWTLARMMHLSPNLKDYKSIKKFLNKTLSYCEVRFSQDRGLNRRQRFNYLVKATNHDPSAIFSKAYLSSLKKILI